MNKILTEDQFWAVCSDNMSDPLSLGKADLSKPFIYERRFGVFYVPPVHHPNGMSLLLAFQHGLHNGAAVGEKLRIQYSAGTADEWLRTTPGACFRSSVGKRVQAGAPDALTVIERRLFGEIQYIFGEARDRFRG